MRARDIMTRDVVTVEPTASVESLIQLLLDHGISGVPVVDDGRLVGVVTHGDLILRERANRPRSGMAYLFQQLFEDHAKLAEEYRKAHGMTAAQVMTREVATCVAGTPVAEVANLMAEKHIKRVPVVEDGTLVGIITRSDVLRALFQRMAQGTPSPSSPLDDDGIARTLIDELRKEPWAEVDHIQVDVRDGVVVLRGLVENEQEREAVEIAARRLPGVAEVRNELAVTRHYPVDDQP